MVNYNLYSLGHDRVLSFDGGGTSSPYEKLETSVIVGSSHGWLALFNPTNSDLFLSNPLTGRHIISGEDPEHEDCRALMIFGTCEILAFCCQGRAGAGWTRIGAHTYPPYNDVRGYEDMDLLGPENYISWLGNVESSRLKTGIWTRALRYLVYAEDLRQLFIVTRHLVGQMAPDGSCVDDSERDGEYPYKTLAFEVHKIDREEGGGGKLSYVDGSLSGLAMFVGLNHSCAVMATNGGLKPDSIYFTDDKVFNPRNSITLMRRKKCMGGTILGFMIMGRRLSRLAITRAMSGA
ncbi:Unknown protein [Striga hermonthica]|uniref:KIB1-4 beta-propeller domain-containing protein n=1 Tax=Striga hermonthica TaxID=68872 RepID=A0A9N7NHR4_STRHE|nr:Unknown protein [Striga hermonthica]